MRLLSFESLPHTCENVLKLIQERLVSRSTSYGLTFAPVGRYALPRPVPGGGDPYVELSALLQRLTSIRLAIQRAPSGTATVCVLDGWVPLSAFPHPVIARLSLDISATALGSCGIDAHEFVYLRGCPHESFERLVDQYDREMTFRDAPESLPTFGDVIGCRDRLDMALIGRTTTCTPFPVQSVRLIEVLSACDENPLATVLTARRALDCAF